MTINVRIWFIDTRKIHFQKLIQLSKSEIYYVTFRSS